MIIAQNGAHKCCPNLCGVRADERIAMAVVGAPEYEHGFKPVLVSAGLNADVIAIVGSYHSQGTETKGQ